MVSLFLLNETTRVCKNGYSKRSAGYKVAFVHILRNAMIPILTGVVVLIPLLFMEAC